jgi:TonB family protein
LAQSSQVTIAGVVKDQTGNLLAGVDVRVDGSALRVLTDANGTYLLRLVSTDSVRVSVRRLGFKPRTVSVAMASVSTPLDIRLEATPQALAAITVSARPEVYDQRLKGFYSRARKGSGNFLTRESLDHLSSGRLTDALRGVPGVRFGQTQARGQGPRSVRLRGANCAPLVFIDGYPATSGEFEIDTVDPWTVEGMEIYHGLATIPAEFLTARGDERCGVVAIWSRPYRPPPRSGRSGKANVSDLVAARTVFTADDVDIVAELKVGTANASYPDSLLSGGVAGRVLTEFVVDSSGLVEIETIGIVTTTHTGFSTSAIAALREASFKPALKNGRPVRQVVQLPFVFEPGRPIPVAKP